MYIDRKDAGNKLADLLMDYKNKEKVIFAIPNGGLPVAAAIVRKIGGIISLMIVRKLQIPYNPEAGFGAVTIDGTVIFNNILLKHLRLNHFQIEQIISKTKADIFERMKYYNVDYTNIRKLINGKLIFVVDDGLASGYTMIAAISSIKNYEPKKIIVAIPTAPKSSVDLVSEHAEVICPHIKDIGSFAVADAYQNWRDLNKEEVSEIIKELKEQKLFV